MTQKSYVVVMIKAERSSHDRNPRLICALVFQRKFTSFAAWIFQNRSTLQSKVLLSSTISHDGEESLPHWDISFFRRHRKYKPFAMWATIFESNRFSLLFAYPWWKVFWKVLYSIAGNKNPFLNGWPEGSLSFIWRG